MSLQVVWVVDYIEVVYDGKTPIRAPMFEYSS